jgi:glutathione reductase (NADPH)
MYVANRLFGREGRPVPYATVATAVFSQPNIGTIGVSEEAALKVAPSVAVYKTTFRSLRNVIAGRQEKAFMKVLVDTETDRVIGMHMLGPEAGEVIQGFAAGITAGMTKRQLDATIGVHPTLAEEFVTLRESFAKLTRN